MTPPAIAITDEQLQYELRSLPHAISLDVARQCPALLICLRNLVEIRARGPRVAPIGAMSVASAPARSPRRPAPSPSIDLKRAAAHDLD